MWKVTWQSMICEVQFLLRAMVITSYYGFERKREDVLLKQELIIKIKNGHIVVIYWILLGVQLFVIHLKFYTL